MQKEKLTNQTIALAALIQAAQVVTQLALTGSCDEHDFNACLESLFILNAPTALSIYGDLAAIRNGLHLIVNRQSNLLEKNDFYDIVGGSFKLARALLNSSELKKKFTSQLSRVVEQKHYFGSSQHPQLMENLSSLYLSLAEHGKLQLKLRGRQQVMQNTHVVMKIRVMLLAAVRAGVLWYQVGGNMLMLLLRRKTYRMRAQELLQEI